MKTVSNWLIRVALIGLGFSSMVAEEEKKVIAVIVGPERHAPGTHEVAAGGRLMAWCLNQAENVPGLEAEVYTSWPSGEEKPREFATLVFIGDQFPGERLDGSGAAMRDLAERMAQGSGIVCVHYATGLGRDDVSPDGDHPLLRWTGGFFATRCDHHQSIARIMKTTITPVAPRGHPIRRGWKAFEVRDEPYVQNWFGRDGLAENAFALATVPYPPSAADAAIETVAWAIERPDGGRGAGITMPHFFRNWENESLRRFILNTIVWTTGVEVPEVGVKTTLPSLETFEPVSVDPRPRR